MWAEENERMPLDWNPLKWLGANDGRLAIVGLEKLRPDENVRPAKLLAVGVEKPRLEEKLFPAGANALLDIDALEPETL
jgi:hypothetical protein